MDSEAAGTIQHVVDLSINFAQIYSTIAANDSKFVDDFIDHVEQYGLNGLPGRLKPSWDIPTNDPFWLKKVQFAQQWHLWHYHLGMPSFDQSKGHGDYTSEWVLHLRRPPCGTRTIIVDWDKHPPFELPKEKYFLMLGDEQPSPYKKNN